VFGDRKILFNVIKILKIYDFDLLRIRIERIEGLIENAVILNEQEVREIKDLI
jgi:hypothetical protein